MSVKAMIGAVSVLAIATIASGPSRAQEPEGGEAVRRGRQAPPRRSAGSSSSSSDIPSRPSRHPSDSGSI